LHVPLRKSTEVGIYAPDVGKAIRDSALPRIAYRVIAGVLLVIIAYEILLLAGAPQWSRGQDFLIYSRAAERWLDGGGFYQPYQVAGPYVIPEGARADAVLYPPPMLILLVPFTILPSALWWVLPAVVSTAALAWLRPRHLALLGILALCAWPTSVGLVWTGNPVIWFAAAGLLGAAWGWPSVLIVLKPTLAPFALLGATNRSWWLALAGLGAVMLAFWPLWGGWLAAVENAQGPRANVLYSIGDVPLMLLPVCAYLGRGAARTRSPRAWIPEILRPEGRNPEAISQRG
jgi:hypothetical protein